MLLYKNKLQYGVRYLLSAK